MGRKNTSHSYVEAICDMKAVSMLLVVAERTSAKVINAE